MRTSNQITEPAAWPFAKHDGGKPRLSLAPLGGRHDRARVAEFGAEKYGEGNWRKCSEPGRLLDAALRHLVAVAGGEELDMESGLPYTAHAAWNLLALGALGAGRRTRDLPASKADEPTMEELARAICDLLCEFADAPRIAQGAVIGVLLFSEPSPLWAREFSEGWRLERQDNSPVDARIAMATWGGIGIVRALRRELGWGEVEG